MLLGSIYLLFISDNYYHLDPHFCIYLSVCEYFVHANKMYILYIYWKRYIVHMLIFCILIISLSPFWNIYMVQNCKLVLLCFSIAIFEWV